MIKGKAHTVTYFAEDVANGGGKTGDSANHTLRRIVDGTASTITASPSEVDATNMPGWYKVDLTGAENSGSLMVVGGKSSTTDIVIRAIVWTNEHNVSAVDDDETAADNLELACDNYSATRGLSGTALPAASADAAGGIPVSDAGGLDLDTLLSRLDAAITTRSSHTAADVLTAFGTGSTLTSLLTATGFATPGDAMTLTSGERASIAAALEAAIINELDGTAVMQAIADLIADDMTTGDLSVQAIASAVRDAILDRVLSGNHDTAGTVGLLMQNMDAAVSSRSSHNASAVITAMGTGTFLTGIPWNSAWDSEVQSEVTDALSAYDPPTKAELDTAKQEIIDEGNANWTGGGGGGGGGLSFTDAVPASPTSGTVGQAFRLVLTNIDGQISNIGGAVGSGAISTPVTIQNGGVPVDGAEVWITTDIEGDNVVAGTLDTGADGVATFMLDSGTYYVWAQRSGINFDNPTQLDV